MSRYQERQTDRDRDTERIQDVTRNELYADFVHVVGMVIIMYCVYVSVAIVVVVAAVVVVIVVVVVAVSVSLF